jgi:S-adenosylmethionine hydrolase
LVTAYNQVDRLAPLAIIGSRDLLEISVNGGNAQRRLGAGVTDRVRVRLI